MCGISGKVNFQEKINSEDLLDSISIIKSRGPDKENILIDTSPDIRSQLLANHVTNIDRILYTHQHGDQTHGINDLRVFYLKKKKVLPIYSDKKTSK